MPRAPRSIPKRARHRKWIKRAKGFQGRRKSVFKLAKEAVLIAGRHAYHDRRKKKTDFRSLWQIRISGAAKANGLSYSRFIHALKSNQVSLDRKVLADLAVNHSDVFSDVVRSVDSESKEKVA